MDTGNLLFDFAHDTYRMQLDQMRGNQSANALMLIGLLALVFLIGTAAYTLFGFSLPLAAGRRWAILLYNLPLILSFLSFLVSVFHLRAAAAQPHHVSLVSSEEWKKVRAQYRLVREHAASDEDLTERFLPSLLDASEHNALINERERKYFRRALIFAVDSLTLLVVQVLVLAVMAVAAHGLFLRP